MAELLRSTGKPLSTEPGECSINANSCYNSEGGGRELGIRGLPGLQRESARSRPPPTSSYSTAYPPLPARTFRGQRADTHPRCLGPRPGASGATKQVVGCAPRLRLPRRQQPARRLPQAYFFHPVTSRSSFLPVTWAGLQRGTLPSESVWKNFQRRLQLGCPDASLCV